jgi:hypothetical protein
MSMERHGMVEREVMKQPAGFKPKNINTQQQNMFL